ncbi:MAG: hypothetical protein GWQ05_09595 [Verrucomicrobiaceae bacterium]|nr:hypothetical protein [Verrucomicrobiaceae bacterium]NCF91196.1 hypothetical protein [Verrucomicrobiaceae bacterium]
MVDYFAKEAKDFDWHLAFHPYPENLFEPRFWNDKPATTSADTPRITFKNLEVLTEHFAQGGTSLSKQAQAHHPERTELPHARWPRW